MPVWIYKVLFLGRVNALNPVLRIRVHPLLTGLLLIMAMGCNQDDMISIPPPELNSLELIKSLHYRQSAVTPDSLALDSLVKYLIKYPELTIRLQSPDRSTLFAPTNKAFKELLKTPLFSAIPGGLDVMNSSLLKTILSYHFLDSTRLAIDLTPGLELPSLSPDPLSPSNFQKIKIHANTMLQGGNLSKTVRIHKKDNLSTNGVVHVVESVLLPHSIDELPTILGTIAFEIMVRDDFSRIATLIQLADSEFEENKLSYDLKIKTLLALPKDDELLTNLATLRKQESQEKLLPSNWVSGITFLAISNDVIASVRTLDQFMLRPPTPASARDFLLRHIIFGHYKTENMTNGLLLYTASSGFRSLLTNPMTLNVVITPQSDFSAINPYGIELHTQNRKKAYIYHHKNLSTANGGVFHAVYDLTLN